MSSGIGPLSSQNAKIEGKENGGEERAAIETQITTVARKPTPAYTDANAHPHTSLRVLAANGLSVFSGGSSAAIWRLCGQRGRRG